MLGCALPCCAVLCFGCRGWPVSLSRTVPKIQEIHWIFAALWPQSQIPRKNAQFRPFCGRDHGRAPKVKKYNWNITENHYETCRDDFSLNLQEIHDFPWFSVKIYEKPLQKCWYARIWPSKLLQKYWYARFRYYFSRAGIVRTTIFLEPESCVPAIFSRKIVVRTTSAIFFRHRFWTTPDKLKI